jgi:tRNA(fMet)-specific endonuclease VapC
MVMNNILIDSNIYTSALKGDHETITVLQRASSIVVSSITIGELLSGFKAGNKEKQNREELAEFLDTPRVLVYGVDENTAEFYSEILNNLRKEGKPIPTNDIWIAAVAFQYGLHLFTKDNHFNYVSGLLLVP